MHLHCISKAQPAQAEAISRVISDLAHYFVPEPDDADTRSFYASIAPDSIAECIANPAFSYYVASTETSLHGVIALRDGKHVHHLFVPSQFQGRGTAGALWAHAKQQARAIETVARFTVNSSVYAVPVYQRLGFDIEGAPAKKNGVCFVPMAYTRAN